MSMIDIRGRRLSNAEARGLRRQVERGELEQVRPGVFVPSGQRQPEIRHRRLVLATAASLGADSVVSHTSAAVMHGLPVLNRHLDRVTVTRPNSNGERTRLIHARRAQLDADEIEFIDGIAVTSLARTVIDLAVRLPFDEALAIADAALRRQLPIDAIDWPGRGSTRVEWVARHASSLSESIGESRSRAAFIVAGLPAPRLQVEFMTASGNLIARTDFYWEHEGVIGEFDGLSKYGAGSLTGQPTLESIRAEKQREGELRDLGHDVVRWIWGDLGPEGRAVQRVRLALERGRR